MFIKYQPKGSKINFSGVSVRCSNQHLAFSNEVWEECFEKAERLELFFDQKANLIGMKGSKHEGLKIALDATKSYKTVRWVAFLKMINFCFTSPSIKKIVREGPLWVIEKEKVI